MSLVIYAALAVSVALGALRRYSASPLTGAGFFGVNGPLATLCLNVVNICVKGMLAGLAAGGMILLDAWRALFVVGPLDALTAFFSFALDAGTLVHKQGLGMAVFHVGLSLCLSIGSSAFCCWLVRMPS